MATDPNNGMMTKVWGPPGWFFLHTVAQGYPVNPTQFDADNDQVPGTTAARYRATFEGLGHVLPCKYCRLSYNQYIGELPMTPAVMADRNSLTRWLWEIHNKVNRKLGIEGPDVATVRRRYERYRAKCKKGVQTGCTIPLNGFKLKSCVLVYPDVCFQTLLIALAVAVALLSVAQGRCLNH